MTRIWLDHNTIKETVEVEKTVNLVEIEQAIEFYQAQVNEAREKLLVLEAQRDELLAIPDRPSR